MPINRLWTTEQIINHRALAHLTEEQRQHILRVSQRLGGEHPYKAQSCFANAQRLALNDEKERITYVEGLIVNSGDDVHHGWNKIDGIEFDVTEPFLSAEVQHRLGEDVPRLTLQIFVLRAQRHDPFFSQPYLWERHRVALRALFQAS
jgi:hypothetical protein